MPIIAAGDLTVERLYKLFQSKGLLTEDHVADKYFLVTYPEDIVIPIGESFIK